MIEYGRFKNKKDEVSGKIRKMNVNERLCPVCQNCDIENEFHFVFLCDAYSILRMVLFNKILAFNDNFNHINIEEKFIYLFKEQNKNRRFSYVSFSKIIMKQ